ncbi:MAG: response regulator [Pseudomonadota bacterium]
MTDIRLLLIDDEDEFRAATSQALTRRGFVVVEAETGEHGLQLLERQQVDVIVLDLRMPGLSGIDTLELMRQRGMHAPVIILTGHGGLDDAVAGIRLGIVDFLQKPVDIDRLAAQIRSTMGRGASSPLRERSIRELMVPASAYRRVLDDEPLRDVALELRNALFRTVEGEVTEQGHRTVLVYDKQEHFVGALRLNDVLRQAVPSFLRDSPYASFLTGMFLAQSKLMGNLPVREALGEKLVIDVEAPLMEALHLMTSRCLINLPVVEAGQVVGVLRDKDLLLEIASPSGSPSE